MFIKVNQLQNKNQFMIEDEEKRYFQSYESLVAIYDKNTRHLTLGRDWNYSNTTKKHLYIFINEYCSIYELDALLKESKNKTKTIAKAIKSGLIGYDPEMR